ncbi:MAG: 5'/3'-nucleotidase SurE [Deltaproteobacteria bacterium]|nr:5'/3'-nucleotidase SurE [Deltaproteobacteria bacterium]
MYFLLTNDDGLDAPGLASMWKALQGTRSGVAVAPSSEQSGASHSLTMKDVIRVHGRGEGRWAVDGTPVDCVYLALHKLCSEEPTLVVSGINKGANLGDDVFYSGTVGAAREAALNGVPSLAVSLDMTPFGNGPPGPHFDTAAAIALRVIEQLQNRTLPPNTFLNLNVPNCQLSDVGGLEICALGRRHYEPEVETRRDPRGGEYFWIGGTPLGERMGRGTDGWWISKGVATLTLLGLDNTADNFHEHLKGWSFGEFNRG